MRFEQQNQFQKNTFDRSTMSGLHSPVSQVHALTGQEGNKIQALSHLARYQNQMSPQEYHEALAQIKAMKSDHCSFGEKKELSSNEDPMKNYQQAVENLKNLERKRW